MISFVGELSSPNDKYDSVNFCSDWGRVRCFQCVFLGGGRECPVNEDHVMGSALLVLDKFCSDPVRVNISCNGSSEIGDNGCGEIVWSSVVDFDCASGPDDVGLSVICESEKRLWFVDKANPGKYVSSLTKVDEDLGFLL